MSDRGLELRIWKNKLYNLQREAPSPHVIPCTRILRHCPPQYGVEYHGPISRQETEELLSNAQDGSYLIRDSQRAENAYTLVIWFDKMAKNFKLYFDPKTMQHYVGETKFDTVELLVADGLIHFYVETRGADVLKKIAEANIYEKTPFYKVRYHTFNAQAVEACLNLKSSENKVMNNERPLPSPLKHLQASQLHANTSKQILASRRQSMDASHLNSHPKYQPVVSTKSPIRDWPEDKHDVKNYRNYPPLAVQQSVVCSPTQQSDTTSNTSSLEVGFSHLKLEPPVDTHSGCTMSSSGVTSSSVIQINTSNRIAVTTNCGSVVKTIFASGHFSPIHSSLVQAPLATCFSGESSSLGSCTNSSSSSHLGLLQSGQSYELESEFSSESLGPRHISCGSNLSDHYFPNGISSHSSKLTESTSNPSKQPHNEFSLTDSDYAQNDAMRNLQERYNLPMACLPDPCTFISNVKPHNFRIHTYRGPHWCDYCTHFIWGLVAQGMKCVDCGFQAHKRCADLVPCDCVPDIKQMKRVFGVDLTNLARAENKAVPTLLIKCIQEVERRGGLFCEGLYRVPGNYDLVEELRTEFDKDPELANISEARVRDINVLTSLIKSFLRQLPVPLITYEAYPDLLDVVRDDRLTEQEKLDLLRKIFARLPGAHYESLRYFISHIHRVSEKQEANLMTAANLAIVLSPTLLSSSYTDPLSCLAGTFFEHALIELLIKHCTYLLPTSRRWFVGRPTELAENAVHSPSNRHSQIITNNNIVTPVTTVSPPPSSYKKWSFLRSRSSTDTRTVPTLSPIP
ncbi:N-chimaerin isoform 1 [Schistosoma japonicum]|uniref:N-chimaerin isoform 1 n=2 Tax=Schistosoma japonicum TaxID=6182 RepID=A0A4Z2DVI1_SCHJA|nr:N-chimaerin [Schistosoma japonicum]TNN20534.1 N-chimaerin isoform 1 [Schistosoma japonicum]